MSADWKAGHDLIDHWARTGSRPEIAANSCDNWVGPGGVGSTPGNLTRSSVATREGLAMQATRIPANIDLSSLPAGVQVHQVPIAPSYYAGSDGHIYSARRTSGSRRPIALARMSAHPNRRDQYLQVWVIVDQKNGTSVGRTFPVHRMVAEAWLGPKPNGLCRRHLNGDRQDNRPSNLLYGTYQENSDDIDRHGRRVRGLAQHCATVSDEGVRAAVAEVMNGGMYRAVGKRYGVSENAVRKWCLRQTRKSAWGDA